MTIDFVKENIKRKVEKRLLQEKEAVIKSANSNLSILLTGYDGSIYKEVRDLVQNKYREKYEDMLEREIEKEFNIITEKLSAISFLFQDN